MPVIATHELSPDNGSMYVYNGLDCLLTHEISTKLDDLASGDDLIYSFSRALQAPAMEMMLRGFRVNPFEREKAISVARSKLESVENILAILYESVVEDGHYNKKFPNSGKQLRDFFYGNMGFKPIETHFGGETQQPMNREILERIENHFFARPFVNAILLFRDLTKTIQTLSTEIDADWRYRTSYNIAGTSTGRWSSSRSGLGTGGNAQNWSDQLRRIFIADEGCKLCGIDLEQAEAREIGWFCGVTFGDWSYLDAAESGDLHTSVTRLVYPDWKWTGDLEKDKALANRQFYRHFTYRDSSKRLAHGSNYLGTAATMAQHTKFPLKFVIEFQERYFDAFPCIPRMHTWVAKEIQTKGYLTNAFGRRRDFFDRPNSPETIRGAVAFLFQSATGDRLNLGLWRIWHEMGTRVQLLAQLHDALYFQYRKNDNEREIIEKAQELMSVELSHGKRMFTIPTEVKVGNNWANRFRLLEDGSVEDWNKTGLEKWKAAT